MFNWSFEKVMNNDDLLLQSSHVNYLPTTSADQETMILDEDMDIDKLIARKTEANSPNRGG